MTWYWWLLVGVLIGWLLSTLIEWLWFRRKRMEVRDERVAELEKALRLSGQEAPGSGPAPNKPMMTAAPVAAGAVAATPLPQVTLPAPDLDAPAPSPAAWTPPSADLPDADLPDVDLPDVDLPDMGLPAVDLPDMGLPAVDLPDMDLPDMDLPAVDLPDMDLPDVDLPDMDLLDVDLPDMYLPAEDLPDVNLPDMDLPDMDRPTVELGSAALAVAAAVAASQSPEDAEEAPAPSPAPANTNYPDDLTQIKGIGRVYETRLYQAKIFTWDQIAQMDVADLEEITQAIEAANAQDWPPQAQMLAEAEERIGARYTGPIPDKFSRIKGIGEGAEQQLYRAGIFTFAQLAAATADDLAAILPTSRGNFTEWIAQAAAQS